MATPGVPRPGNAPPYYNPSSVTDGMQNLQINRPTGPPGYVGPRPPTPLGQQPPPPFSSSAQRPSSFSGSFPMTRPGAPPPGVLPGGPLQATLPQNVASYRPSGPPPPFGSRPPPPGSLPSSMSTSGVPPGAFPSTGQVAPPSSHPNLSPFGSSSPLTTGPIFPPSSTPGPASNGPPAFGSGGMQRGPQFSSAGSPPPPLSSRQVGPAPSPVPFTRAPSPVPFTRAPSPVPNMRPLHGSPPTGAPSGPMQPPPFALPFPSGMPPPSGSLPFAAPPQGVAPPSGSPYGQQAWQMQPRQVAPAPPIPGSSQPPRMFGMPPQPPDQSMATISPAMGHMGAPMAGPSKIDPNQIPRPIPSISVILHETRQGNQANLPPPATSDYIVKDTGNCSPRYMRCTINQIPCTVDLLTTSGMQLALMVQPLALPHPSEEPIQLVDFGESGPVRCSRCKGYVNPFMKFIDQGRRFVCNLCGYTDETPSDYQCNLGPDGRRRDADERPELCRGTVEFVATKEYMVRDPMPAVFFFLIDVSMNAIQIGATAAACSAISQVIADLPDGPRTMVGVATFDSTIHFYNLKRELQQPLMLIVPDVQDVYTPLQADVIVQLSECRQHLELLLENIPTMFENNRTADSAFGAAVKAGFLAMKNTGGKLLVFQSVLPSVGFGALSAREAEGRTNISAGEKEAHKLLQPADKVLKAMAVELAEYQVCVDVFITTQTYVDIASISVIPRTTGGKVYYYFPFSALSEPAKLYNDLRWNVTRPQGFEAVMRVRCSQGIQVQEYSGNFCKRIPTDVDLPTIDCDKTIMVTLKHDDKLQDGSECAFQCALLYTTVYGQRRIRVSTLSLPCTTLLSNLFRSADLDTQFACFLKQVANEIPSSPLPQVREQVTNLCINILHSYRKFCATVSSAGQLILPEALKLLPLYTLGFYIL
ncbi:protein transport protein SEC24 C isoform X2 [Rhododendron vialii]|uniref:protein transport protein SEC24 C isoform X2 n=1 Tax=Rhododendron vialii TaxID=182163 RepID=UPI00265E1F70|nr:protein transport protein SEC24 C isoform X2 [Rhododendron vialii]